MTIEHYKHEDVADAVGGCNGLQHHMYKALNSLFRQRGQGTENPCENPIEKHVKRYRHRRIPPCLGVQHQHLGQH